MATTRSEVLVGVNGTEVTTVDPVTSVATPLNLQNALSVSSVFLGGETAGNGFFYFITPSQGGGGLLYTVNTETGKVTSAPTTATNFALDTSTGKLVGINNNHVTTIDPTTGAVAQIGSLALTGAVVGAEAAEGGLFYFIASTATSGPSLYTVKIATGQVISSPATSARNFVLDASTGKLVGINTVNGSLAVTTVDPTSGAVTRIGSLSLTGIILGAEAAGNGKLYFIGTSAGTQSFFVVDIATGNLVGEAPVSSTNFVGSSPLQGLDFSSLGVPAPLINGSPSSIAGVRTGVGTGVPNPQTGSVAGPQYQQNSNYSFLAQYLGAGRLTLSLAKQYVADGLQLVTVWQTKGATGAGYFNAGQGKKDGEQAFIDAKAVGAPSGSAIYFGVDFSATAANMPAIISYFQGVAQGFAAEQSQSSNGSLNYAIGVYGGGTTLSTIIGLGLAKYAWLSASSGWDGTAPYVSGGNPWNIDQTEVTNPVTSIGPHAAANPSMFVDLDVASSNAFGQWSQVNPPPKALPVRGDFYGTGTSDVLFAGPGPDLGFYQMDNGVSDGWQDVGSFSSAYAVAGTGNFTGSGTDGILFRNSASGDTGFYNIVNGVNNGWVDVGGSSTAYSVVGVGDFMGNGNDDILFRNSTFGDTGFYRIVNGVNKGWVDIGGSSPTYSGVGVGDFMGTGTDDVLFRNNSTGDTGFYAMVNGVNTGWHDVGGSSTAYQVVGVGDLMGNGTSDILFRNNTTGDVGFYNMVNGVNTGWVDIGASSPAYSVVGVGNYMGDGTSGILFRNNTTGDTGFYQIAGGLLVGWQDIGPSSAAYRVVG
jgi:hypothetical protein